MTRDESDTFYYYDDKRLEKSCNRTEKLKRKIRYLFPLMRGAGALQRRIPECSLSLRTKAKGWSVTQVERRAVAVPFAHAVAHSSRQAMRCLT